jgi:anti-sigma regulatory factor (Ser/Thr protein kinase)
VEQAPLATGKTGAVGQVFVLAPPGRDANVACIVLDAEAGITASPADMAQLCQALPRGTVAAAVITDEMLTPEALSTLSEALAAQPAWSDFPLIILAGGGQGTPESRLALVELGSFTNATILERPLRVATLISAVKVALRSRARQYELRAHLEERERLETRHRTLLKDMLASVTDGKLRLCDSAAELPERLPSLGEEDTLALSGQTLRVLRRRTTEAGQAAGLDKDRGNDLLTAVNETAMNAIVHAGGGTASVGASLELGKVQVWVEDQGMGIDMRHLPQATLDRGYTTAGTLGHGFKMVIAVADCVWLLTGPKGTTVVLEQNRDVPTPGWLRP